MDTENETTTDNTINTQRICNIFEINCKKPVQRKIHNRKYHSSGS